MFRRHWIAALLFVVLALALTNPLILHIWNAVEDKQDGLLNTWIIAWVGHAAITDPLHLYNTNIFYPYVNTLAFSEVLIPQGLIALPLTLATDNPIFGYNVVLLSMLWLDAFAMYLLVLDWTGRREAGWVAGAIYAFNPFNLSNLAQVQLVALGWLPLALLFLGRIRQARTVGGGLRNAFLFSLFIILQSLSSIYYALIGGVAVACYVVYLLFKRPGSSVEQEDISPPRRKERKEKNIKTFASPLRDYRFSPWQFLSYLALSAVFIGFVLTPFLLPYFSVQRDLGFERKVQESEPFSASLKQFTEVSPQNVVYGKLLAPNPVRYAGGYPLDNLFPGVFALGLAAYGLVRGKGNVRWFLLASFLIAFILALGPRLYLAAGQPTDITLPYRWLYDLFSPLRALRAPVRFEAVIMLSLAALAGIGLAVVASGQWTVDSGHSSGMHPSSSVPSTSSGQALRPPSLSAPRLSPLIALGWVALISIEYLALPAANITPMPVAGEIAPVYRWLAAQPHGVVLELPMMGPDANKRPDISKQYYTTYHWQDTPDGYSGFFVPGRGPFELEMRGLPNSRSISLLQAYDVRYVVMHWDELAAIPGTPTRGDLEDVEGLSLVQEWDNVSVYAVAPAGQTPNVLEKTLYVPQPIAAGAPFTAYIILHNTGTTPFSTRVTDKVQWRASWGAGGEEQVSTGLPLVTSSASVVPVRLTAPAQTGTLQLRLGAESGPLGAFTLAQEVSVGQEMANETVIPARVELGAPLESTYAAGAAVEVTLDWLPLAKIDAYYSASVRLVDDKGNKVLNVDREPVQQTLLWIPDTIVKDSFRLELPSNLKPGKYRVEVLMYDANADTNALLLDDAYHPVEQVQLGEVEIK